MSWKRWNYLFFTMFLASTISIISTCEYLLYRFNENLDINQSVEKQINENIIYGRLLLGQDAIYKIKMTKKLKPEIVAVGSSRVMQFRQEFFNNTLTFYNAGGVMPNIDRGIEFINDITKEYTPKIVIIGIDLWSLNGNFNEKDDIKRDLIESNLIQRRLFLYGSLFNNLTNGNIRKLGAGLFSTVNYQELLDPFEHRRTIGLLAAINGDGFRSDGSYQYGGIISGKVINDKYFKDTHRRIVNGVSRFEYASEVDRKRLNKIIKLIELLKNKGIQVVVFAPPFAHEIYEAMNNSQNHKKFLQSFHMSIKQVCKQENVNFYDFSDVTWYGSNDNETIDGFHGSETSYAKLALAMKNDSILGRYINKDQIIQYISKTNNPKYCIPIQ